MKNNNLFTPATIGTSILIFCLAIGIIFNASSTLSEPSENESPSKSSIVIRDSIKLDDLFQKTMAFKLLPNPEHDGLDIWNHDGTGLSINKFSTQGKLLNSIKLPTIDEPIGLNRISDFFVYNTDSIFVYDAQYRRLALVNQASEVLNLWLMNNYIPELSADRNNEIVDVYKNDKGELKIDLSGFNNTYYQSDRNFFLKNTLMYQVNLITNKVNKGITYPEGSAYREYMFWSGAIPYVRKTEDGYLAVFPLDEKIYSYTTDLKFSNAESTQPENFPKAKGNQFGSPQEMNFARIDRKLNGFNLKIRSAFDTEQGTKFAKIYRAPLGDDPSIPDDYMTFLQGNYQSQHFLQIFDVVENKFVKKHHDIEIGQQLLGNLLHIDRDNQFYFLKNDPNSEEQIIMICGLKGDQNPNKTNSDYQAGTEP